MMKKGLYIIATPIGNLGDISQRAIETLENVDIVACEDTRVTKKLFSLLGISNKKTFISLHDHNEEETSEKIINLISIEGKSIALVSDAGSPLISDPGYKLVRQAKKENIYITTVPGASALISALQLSGLPSDRFMFAGFIPSKEKAREDFLGELKNLPTTLIFYETAPRILKTLLVAKNIFKDRDMCVVREISKLFEEHITGKADDLISHFQEKKPKGEIVFLIAPPLEEKVNLEELKGILKEYMQRNSLKNSVDEVAELYSFSKKEIYSIALEIKNEI